MTGKGLESYNTSNFFRNCVSSKLTYIETPVTLKSEI